MNQTASSRLGSVALRLAVLLGLLTAAGVLGWIVLRSRSETQRRLITLPEGVPMRFLAVRMGGAAFTTEKTWERLLRRYLPARLTRALPSAVSGSCGSGTNSLTAYFLVLSTNASTAPWQSYWAEGDDGFRYQREAGYCSFGGPAEVYGLTLRAFPRRQPDFWIVFGDSEQKPLARCRIPNPVAGPFPKWPAGSLPQTHTNGPVILTLESARQAGQPNFRFLKPKWTLASDDPLWAEAQPGSATVFDPTGNEGSWLSLREPAWKIRAVVHRRGFEAFLPHERLVVSNLTVPETASVTPIDISRVVSDVGVTVRLLAPAGKLTLSNDVVSMAPLDPGVSRGGHSTTSFAATRVETWTEPFPFALLRVAGLGEFDELRCRLVDAQGRAIESTHRGYQTTSGGARNYVPVFESDHPGGPVTLEIVISRPLIFEFFIDPAEVNLPTD